MCIRDRDNKRSFKSRKQFPIKSSFFLIRIFMPCYKCYHGSIITMRDWNSSISRNCDRRSNTRHYLDFDTFSRKRLGFFASAPEKIWVSAFEAYYDLSFFCPLDKQLINLPL